MNEGSGIVRTAAGNSFAFQSHEANECTAATADELKRSVLLTPHLYHTDSAKHDCIGLYEIDLFHLLFAASQLPPLCMGSFAVPPVVMYICILCSLMLMASMTS